jgi:chitin disaccharide deacetylase
MGIHPTHLDSHMGSLFTTPAVLATYMKIAHEYHLPFLALRDNMFGPPMPIGPNDIPLDALIQAFPSVTPEKWKDFYLNAIANLKPGLTEIIVHLGHDDAELQAVTVNNVPWGSAWRQRDYDVVNSPEFKKALKDNKVILIKWRDLQKLVQQP